MNHNQDANLYAAQKQIIAIPLLFISILSGICGFVLFTDLYWWVVIPALICGLTGWAAFVLLFSASKVVEEEKKAKADAMWGEDPSVDPTSAAQLIEVEEKSGTVGIATALGIVALLLFVGLKFMGKIDRFMNNRVAGDMEIKKVQAVPDKGMQGLFPSKNNELPLPRLLAVREEGRKRQLVTLNLSADPEVEDALIEKLIQRFPNLQHLDLRYTSITDVGAQHLTSISTLRELRLGGTAVSAEMIAKLQAALPECEIDTETEEVE